MGFIWPVFLTNWSCAMLTFHVTLAAIIVVLHTIKNRGHQDQNALRGDSPPPGSLDATDSNEFGFTIPIPTIPWYMKLNWLIFAVISNIAFIVTAVYFGFLYPYLEMPGLTFIDFSYHGLNSIIILVEMSITRIPVNLLHFIYPLLYGIAYILFSVIFWAADHNNVIYPKVLDWNHPGITVLVTSVLGFVVVPVLQFVLFGLYRLRVFIYNKVTGRPM